MHVEVGDVAVHRRANLRAGKVQLRGLQLRLGVLVIGQGRVGDIAGVVTVFPGNYQAVQVGAPMQVYRNPVNTFVAGFLANPPMNLVTAKAQALLAWHPPALSARLAKLYDDYAA